MNQEVPTNYANPLRLGPPPPTQIFYRQFQKRRQSIFTRILLMFLVLAFVPMALETLFGWIVYVGSINKLLSPAAANTIVQALLVQIILIWILIIIIVIFMASITSRSLLRPLQHLLELTELVAGGKLNYRLKAYSSDEIGELTDAFNLMIQKLREGQEREKIISRLKSEFISIAAHQLRTPLSAVKWTFQAFLAGDMGALSKEQVELLQRGYETNEHMISLVGDLLETARIEEGRFGYTFTQVDFVAYIKDFVNRFMRQALSRRVVVVFQEPSVTIQPVRIDKSGMDIVLQNILDNSVKYSYPRSKVIVSLAQLPQYVEVRIVDEGIGIPAGQAHRLFTKFFRAGNAVKMETEGSGLGLFIVRNIVKNHGGSIRIESQENKSTTVIFTIPIFPELIPRQEKAFEDFVSGL